MKEIFLCLILIIFIFFAILAISSLCTILIWGFIVYFVHRKNGKYKIKYREIKNTILNSVYYSRYFDFFNSTLYIFGYTFYLSFPQTIMMMYWCEHNIYLVCGKEMTNLVKTFFTSIIVLFITFLIFFICFGD